MSKAKGDTDRRRKSMDKFVNPFTQVAFKFERGMYAKFRAGCISRETSPNRLIEIWMQRQVEAWNAEIRKEVLPAIYRDKELV